MSSLDPVWLEELAEFLRIPSVSADPTHAEDVRRAGQWVCDFVTRSGGSCELRETARHPLAVGEIPASQGRTDEDVPYLVLGTRVLLY